MTHKVLVLLWKDLLFRRNHYIITAFEILLPLIILLKANTSSLPERGDVDNEFMNNTIKENCTSHSRGVYKIVYEPGNAFTKALMQEAQCHQEFIDVRAGSIDDPNASYRLGIKFKGTDGHSSALPPDTLEYEFYPASTVSQHVRNLWRSSSSTTYFDGPLKLILRSQMAIDYSFLKMKNIEAPQLNFLNTDLFTRSVRVYSIVVIIAFFIAFSFMIPTIVSRIVQEKRTGAKELMLMMGIKRWHLWLSKILDSLCIYGLVVLLMVVLLHVPITSESHVLTRVSPFLSWGLMTYGLLGIFLFVFFLSCFFEHPTLAVFISQIIWLFSFVAYTSLTTDVFKMSRGTRLLCCLLPPACFLDGLSVLLDFDFYGKTVRFGERLSMDEGYLSLRDIFLMMTLDIMVYSILTWYFEQVKPGNFGVPKPYGFVFMKSYWFPNAINMATTTSTMYGRNEAKNEDFETVSPGMKVGISVANVSKEYKSLAKGSILAVDNISIDFYSGEISTLLGHNGAGKTTTFSIITGLTYPSSGRVFIDGYDVTLHVERARRSLGLCPQKDMLFDDLNVTQILLFFGMIKGLSGSEASREARELAKKLKLKHVERTPTSKLSGGQKRKVSLAIALIGGSKVVLLDEPTSGLDPEIRREIWEILLELRGSRTILLTTHFMEEADALSDRIAIMDHGKIKCYGTPMYLKLKYGSGYTLSVVVNDTGQMRDVTNFIKELLPATRYKGQNVLTLTYQLPGEEVAHFPRLLSALDEKQKSGEIASYSVAFSTFEDVFLRMRQNETEEVVDVADGSPYKRLNGRERCSPNVEGFVLLCYQIHALFVKKWIYFTRNMAVFAVFSVVPLLIVVANVSVVPAVIGGIARRNASRIGEVVPYSLDVYRDSRVLYSSSEAEEDEEEKAVTKVFQALVRDSGSNVKRVSNVTQEIIDVFASDFHVYARKLILAVEFDSRPVIVRHNADAVHMLPVSVNLLHNAYLRLRNPSNRIATSVNFTHSDRDRKVIRKILGESREDYSCSVADVPGFIGLQVLFYLIGPIRENYHGAKHLQLMSTSSVAYWLTHLLFDLAAFLVYLAVAFFIYWFSREGTFLEKNAGEIFLGLILWAVGLLLIAYLMASFIKSIATASKLNLIVYSCFTYLVYNLLTLDILPANLQYLHPSCIVKIGFLNLCSGIGNSYKTALIAYDAVLFACLILKDSQLAETVFHLLLNRILKVDYSSTVEKDAAVAAHEEEIERLLGRGDMADKRLIVRDLRRWYFDGLRRRPAVRGISFAVNKGECFGLLGVNGAGKTTSFSMLTGAIPASRGTVLVNVVQLFSFFQKSEALFHIGYCPQYGGIIPTLKGKELLQLFARLRGVARHRIDAEVLMWIEELHLMEHANTPIEKYSGGNQRKLSVAVALIGNCRIVFLDEPTSGVDPVTRRAVWKVIGNLRGEGKSVVLTSHSMDECEAVCTRLAIMVNGCFRCVGEIPTLKDTFGQGFTIQLKISGSASVEEQAAIKAAMSRNFDPGCNLIDEHLTVLEYHVTNPSIKWDVLFALLNDMKVKMEKLESFTATATTLERIFIYFARNQ